MTPLSSIPLRLLLPQRPPFVMIDALTAFDENTTTTRFTVRDECMLVTDGVLTPYGLIENAAQTCAARLGYANYIRHTEIRIGFIGAVRDFRILRRPHVGETLTTTIRVMEEIFGLTLVSAETHSGDELIASGEMKIAIQSEDHEKA